MARLGHELKVHGPALLAVAAARAQRPPSAPIVVDTKLRRREIHREEPSHHPLPYQSPSESSALAQSPTLQPPIPTLSTAHSPRVHPPRKPSTLLPRHVLSGEAVGRTWNRSQLPACFACNRHVAGQTPLLQALQTYCRRNPLLHPTRTGSRFGQRGGASALLQAQQASCRRNRLFRLNRTQVGVRAYTRHGCELGVRGT